jgi:exonuclease VII small subunit
MESDWAKIRRLLSEGKVDEATAVFDEAIKEAKVQGLRLFAWWKDGVQYVGTCGTTLEKAIQEISG